jgi:hypothetical protein
MGKSKNAHSVMGQVLRNPKTNLNANVARKDLSQILCKLQWAWQNW